MAMKYIRLDHVGGTTKTMMHTKWRCPKKSVSLLHSFMCVIVVMCMCLWAWVCVWVGVCVGGCVYVCVCVCVCM